MEINPHMQIKQMGRVRKVFDKKKARKYYPENELLMICKGMRGFSALIRVNTNLDDFKRKCSSFHSVKNLNSLLYTSLVGL